MGTGKRKAESTESEQVPAKTAKKGSAVAPATNKDKDDGTGAAQPVVAGYAAAASAASSLTVNPKRVRQLKDGAVGNGPVIYWMSRDQRIADNWALLYAAQQAQQHSAPVAVVFNLVPAFLGAGARQFVFMLQGLRELQPKLQAKGIQFFMLRGDPAETIPQLMTDVSASLLVTDYSPLRLGRQWRQQVGAKLSVPFHEVDAHNVVPVWVASEKREVGARTLRPKIHKHLPEFLREFPAVPDCPAWTAARKPEAVDWDALLKEVTTRGAAVPPVDWCKPGEDAARDALLGPAGFLSPSRLALYESKRNDPAEGQALSHLSPYLHYGQLAPQRAALEAAKHRSKYKASVESFLEELVVRRELSDNFCEHAPDDYDKLSCAAQWARDTLDAHRNDKREWIYTRQQLEAGQTHDELWNASQVEMVVLGKMHGFMRMYWAKKILEWTASPEEAIETAIYLNDKYELDGRDPSGYVGVMWSMAGIHDQGWGERPIFGKIRYMNYNGCKRKFKIEAYVNYVNRRVAEVRRQGGLPPVLAPTQAAAAAGLGPGTSATAPPAGTAAVARAKTAAAAAATAEKAAAAKGKKK